jgi:hypothetical protein
VRKDSIDHAIDRRQPERNRRDAEQTAAVVDQPPGPEQSHAAGALQVSLQGVEKVLVGCRAFEESIAKARIETTNAQVTPAHGVKLPLHAGQLRVAQIGQPEICPVEVRSTEIGAVEIRIA